MGRHKRRDRQRNFTNNDTHIQSNPSSQQFSQPKVRNVVGMFSIKTIRNRNGTIIVKQGEIISEEVLSDKSAEEVWDEIAANAMAGRKR
jgi:hypothetical protein